MKMQAFSFEAQTQRVKDVCLHFTLSLIFLSPFPPFLCCIAHMLFKIRILENIKIFLKNIYIVYYIISGIW